MDSNKNNLPASIQGDGRKFISLLKNYLQDLKDTIQDNFDYVNKIFNATADNPDTIEEQVHSIRVDEKNVNGRISLTLKWNSDEIKNYAGAVIDLKESSDYHEDDWGSIEWSRKFVVPKTNTYTIENCFPGRNYLIRVRGKDITNALSKESAAPTVEHYVSEFNHVPRPPYEFTVIFDKRGAYWSWKQYEQNEYMWTELRLDQYPGEAHNRLDITADLFSIEKPTARTGTAYLYNKGVGNAYSEPCVITYSAPVLPAPKNITVEPVFEGLSIKFDNFPDTAVSAVVYVNNEPHEVKTNHFTYLCSTGTYKIKIAFKDPFGEGAMSKVITQSTEEEIPPDAVHITRKTVFDDGVIVGKYIGDRQIVGTKIVEDTITTGHLRSNAVTASKINSNAVTAEKIDSGAVQTKHMTVNTIEGDRIKTGTLNANRIKAGSITSAQIAADSILGGNIKAGEITGAHIKTESITSDKLKVNSLSSLAARIGLFKSNDSGARVEISDTLIAVYDENNRLRVRFGMW